MQRIPDECNSHLTNLILLTMGMFQARSVQLHLMARKTPVRAKKLSLVKRFEPFLQNKAVQVREWYYPFAFGLARVGGSDAFAPVTLSVLVDRRSLAIQPEAYAQPTSVKKRIFHTPICPTSGIESRLSQGTRCHGLHRMHYFGLDKTHLRPVLTVVALKFVRIGRWLEEQPLAKTRPSAFVRLCRPEAA
jgi:hypothetical protein